MRRLPCGCIVIVDADGDRPYLLYGCSEGSYGFLHHTGRPADRLASAEKLSDSTADTVARELNQMCGAGYRLREVRTLLAVRGAPAGKLKEGGH